MNKPLLGILVGGVLGVLDGLSAWFTPEARPEMVMIVMGSTMKGMLAGVLAGFFARKVHSLTWGLVFGLAVGAFLAYLVAAANGKYYLEIILPGSLVGAIAGFATQRYPASAARV